MKPTTSRPRERQSPIGGDVSKLEGAKPEASNRGCRHLKVTLQLTSSELAELTARAQAVRLPLSTFIRREVMRLPAVSSETALLLTELGRTRELITRLWAASSEEGLDGSGVQRIASQVAAIDARVLVVRATGGLP